VDIKTGQLMLEPSYNYNTPDGNPVMTGFIATQILDVNVRDIGQLGTVLDAVVTAGGNRVNGIMFDVSDPQLVTDEARRDAVADARGRAELYAEAADLALARSCRSASPPSIRRPCPCTTPAAPRRRPRPCPSRRGRSA
jgi:uncharacterized protein YggE